MKRLFVAIDLPAEVRSDLQQLCCGLPGARWVAPEQMHLTLRFIGDVDGAVFRDILEALAEVRVTPFSLQLKDIGFFPPRGKPRVVWVGVTKNDELLLLQKRIETVLQHIGLEPEGRKYSPHITLARLKDTSDGKAAVYHNRNALYQSPPFQGDQFVLYSSVLGKSGAQHLIEQIYPIP